MEHQTNGERQFELKLDAGRPLPDVIGDKVRELIEAGVFKPGNRLPNESELSRSMKVARSSVRTALQRLETLRIVEVKRGLGWYVRRTPPAEAAALPGLLDGRRYRLSDLFELRIGLEGLAASLAAVRTTPGEVEDIAKLNRQHQDAAEDQDELARSDRAFHEAIVAASGNALLIETYHGLIGELDEWRHQSFAVAGVPLRSARDHTKIVRYLGNNDAGGARAAMNGHLYRLYDELTDLGSDAMDTTYCGPEGEPAWHERAGQG